jgi:hypothetical protein
MATYSRQPLLWFRTEMVFTNPDPLSATTGAHPAEEDLLEISHCFGGLDCCIAFVA